MNPSLNLIKQVTSTALTESPIFETRQSFTKLQQEKEELRRMGLSSHSLLGNTPVGTNGEDSQGESTQKQDDEDKNMSRTLEALDLELSTSVQI